MAQLPPACPRCRDKDASLIRTKEAFVNDPPEAGEKPVSLVAIFQCRCGHVFTDVQRLGKRPRAEKIPAGFDEPEPDCKKSA